ncbi:MAG TPA: hypothetical protein PK812_02505 [Beijerinckiaceae bacterium]|nr:hypothetical protein [Beijerinckiaceae bacterium]
MTQILDIARGAYAKLPYSARSQIGKVLQFVPARHRYGATHQLWRDRLVRTRDDAATLKALQDEARVSVVRAAYEKSRWYRSALTRAFGASFDPASVLKHDMWSQVPLLTPDTVTRERDALCTRPVDDLDRGNTGGTSGQPVQFYLDRNRSPIEYAFVFDAWARAGYRAGDWRAVFRGVEVQDASRIAIERDPALAEVRFSIFNLTDEMMRRFHSTILRDGIRYLHGYPSAIGMFASFLQRAGLAPMPQIKGVFLMGERLYPNYRNAIEAAFPHASLVPFFGLSEKCAFAVEVAGLPDVYDFEPLYGYTELLDRNDQPVTQPGARGRLVSTGLLFKGMPFLRYDTRDEATLVASPSAANGWKLRVERIVPRRGHEFLVSRDNRLIPILALVVFGDEMLAIREFQFVQDRPGEALLKVVRAAGASHAAAQAYIDLIRRKTGGLLTLSAEYVDELPPSPRAKRRFVDQRLDIAAVERSMNLSADATAAQ